MSRISFMQPLTGVVKHLVIINTLMFLASYVLLGEELYATDEYASSPYMMLGRLKLAVFLPGSEYFRPYQIATHMFMHFDLRHLVFNMLSLYFFGTMVEMVWGAKRFLFYYIVCGLGSWVLYTIMQWQEVLQMGFDPRQWPWPMMGASGAVFGVMAAFAFNFPNKEINLMFPPVALKAKYLVMIMMGVELFFGSGNFSTGIAHYAHLGGAFAGLLLIGIWTKFTYK
jgi:membrane associated rhomboid family serine protease